MYLEAINENGAQRAYTPAASPPPASDEAIHLAIAVRGLEQAYRPTMEDREMNALTLALHRVLDRLIALPAATPTEVEAKLVGWNHLVENECIIDVDLWRQFVAEVSMMLRRTVAI